MEALKKFDMDELLKRQAMLDKKFDEKKTLRERTQIRTFVAFIAELGELTQELKSEWNYWKNNTEKINKRKVLEELSDCLHFYLSFINQGLFRNSGSENVKFYKRCIENLEIALIFLSKFSQERENKIIAAMLIVAEYVGATEKEFLQVHHEKWLKNMNERTKEEY